jgi:spore germination protein YaaH
MRQLLSILALLSLSAFSNANLQDFSISPEEAREILGRKLGDEIFLKERLRLENAQKKAGEIISHKVGNGFQIARPNPTLEELVRCKIRSTDLLMFILLESSDKEIVAVLTANSEQENLAEFREVRNIKLNTGFSNENFYSGQNFEREEMFQFKFTGDNQALLTIVINQKLYLLQAHCWAKQPH